ncbi:MAG: hypothetical protein GY845_02345, partial [Planctomycetes bacterium]|nr:hypothetical protein [Planctomycetota bacterium]
FFEYLVDGLLRGDAAARSSYYNQMFMIGGITQNEIRSKENMNPIEGGDVAYVPLNMIPIDQVGQETPEEPQEEKKSRESRSIVVRDRITKQYLPLLRKSAQKIINLEGNALKKQLKKHRKQRAKEPLQQWLDKFYIDMPEKIKREMGPVFKAFSEAIRSAAQDEIGKDTDISKFVADYIDRYADRHTESSQGPLVSLLGGEIDDLEARVDEWAETRADKIAASETLFLSDAIYEQVAMPVGVKTTWRTENRDISKLRELEANIIPKISRVAQKILNYETSKIKKAIEKLTRSQADDVNEWLEDFYNQHGAYVRVKFAPVMEKYAHAINREASRIVGKPLGMTPEVEQYTKDYLEKYAFRYCHAGKRQLQALIIEEALNPELFKVELVQRLEEWLEKRADKIAADESVRASNALSREVWRNHGVTKLKWVARGESCPFCNHLNGKVVGIEKNFLEAGDVIYVNDKLPGKNHIYNPLDPNSKKPDVDYDDPLTNQANWQALKTHGQKAHAPIHRGCDCRVMPV